MRLEVGSVAAVAAAVAVAAYIRRLRAELAAAKRDNDEIVAAAARDTRSQQQAPPQQAPPQQTPPQQAPPTPVAWAPAPRKPINHPTTAIDGRDVAGYMFVCTAKNEDDVEKHALLGAPSAELGTLEQLVNNLPRAPLFLFKLKSRRLDGPLNAAKVGYSLVHNAFEGKFKAHVCFTRRPDVTTTIVLSGTTRLQPGVLELDQVLALLDQLAPTPNAWPRALAARGARGGARGGA